VAVRVPSGTIQRFIVRNVESHPRDIVRTTAENFGMTERAVSTHVNRLCSGNILVASGTTTDREHRLAILEDWRKTYEVVPNLSEDTAWEDAAPVIGSLPESLLSIWNGGFTEMFNNAVDHSAGTLISVHIRRTAINTELALYDDGVGIFKKIQLAFNLDDERHAILQLSKGKLTTDPKKHSGLGIFFTSRMFDSFDILSGGLFFTHESNSQSDWLMQRDHFKNGTGVWMKIDNESTRTAQEIYNQYAGPEHDYAFAKTVVPVRLAQYSGDRLVSRSQAKMVLAGLEKFAIVHFNFKDVETIGQSFADEIFRVFAKEHPEMQIESIGANAQVEQMIRLAKNGS
jgi:anti-sigma regulatory factor (Ser/Thr protein kinase)